MADIKIYGKLVANTEDQIVANDNSIQDTINNQKLNVTLADLKKDVFPIIEITDINITMSQLYTNGNRFRIKLNPSVGNTQYNDFYSVEMYYSSGNNTYVLTLISLTDPQRRYYANTLVSYNTLYDLFNLHPDSLIDQFTLDTALENKQDTLYSGLNIKTINGQSILGEGNIEIQGGSGSASSILKNYAETLTLKDGNGTKICGIHRVLALKTKEWYYGVLNNGVSSAASQLQLTVPTVTSDATMETALNTILQAMQQYCASANIPLLLLNYLTDFDFVIKQKVSNNGTEYYPLFITGDISAYIMETGSFTDLFTKFDLTDAYSVEYYTQEVIVTD